MIILDCANDTVILDPDASPCASGVTAATVSSRKGFTEIPVNTDTLGPIPAELPDGVYKLNLHTPCGCFDARLYLHRCGAPAFAAKHTATFPERNKIAPECCPEPSTESESDAA